jgi:hypothetical protein
MVARAAEHVERRASQEACIIELPWRENDRTHTAYLSLQILLTSKAAQRHCISRHVNRAQSSRLERPA